MLIFISEEYYIIQHNGKTQSEMRAFTQLDIEYMVSLIGSYDDIQAVDFVLSEILFFSRNIIADFCHSLRRRVKSITQIEVFCEWQVLKSFLSSQKEQGNWLILELNEQNISLIEESGNQSSSPLFLPKVMKDFPKGLLLEIISTDLNKERKKELFSNPRGLFDMIDSFLSCDDPDDSEIFNENITNFLDWGELNGVKIADWGNKISPILESINQHLGHVENVWIRGEIAQFTSLINGIEQLRPNFFVLKNKNIEECLSTGVRLARAEKTFLRKEIQMQFFKPDSYREVVLESTATCIGQSLPFSLNTPITIVAKESKKYSFSFACDEKVITSEFNEEELGLLPKHIIKGYINSYRIGLSFSFDSYRNVYMHVKNIEGGEKIVKLFGSELLTN